MRNLSTLLSGLALLSGCGVDLTFSQDEAQATVVTPGGFGAQPLQLTAMKNSHNTYANTPNADINWHFTNNQDSNSRTYHIEIDLVDSNYGGGWPSGNWWVAHSFFDSPTTKCGGTGLFSDCLNRIKQYHVANPGHPFITVIIDKKDPWQNFNQNATSRSPWRLDNLISSYFSNSELWKPEDMFYWDIGHGGVGTTVRQSAINWGWPLHSQLAGKLMFMILPGNPGGTYNQRLEQYAVDRQWSAKVFILPSGESKDYVLFNPGFANPASVQWVAMYNFEWEDDPVSDSNCDSTNNKCRYIGTAHCLNFLTRAWDIDTPTEYDYASAGGRVVAPSCNGNPFSTPYPYVNANFWMGHANFIAIDNPWVYGAQNQTGAYGNFPNGIYDW